MTEWQLFYDMTNSKLRSGNILHIQQDNNCSSLCGRDCNYGLSITFPVPTPICPECLEIKVIELNEQAEIIANLQTLLAQRDNRIQELETLLAESPAYEAMLTDGSDDTTAPEVPYWKNEGTPTEEIPENVLDALNDTPDVLEPLDRYDDTMSYFGGYSNNFRLVTAWKDGYAPYWIIAVKKESYPGGESIMYRYDNIHDALPKFLEKCQLDQLVPASVDDTGEAS